MPRTCNVTHWNALSLHRFQQLAATVKPWRQQQRAPCCCRSRLRLRGGEEAAVLQPPSTIWQAVEGLRLCEHGLRRLLCLLRLLLARRDTAAAEAAQAVSAAAARQEVVLLRLLFSQAPGPQPHRRLLVLGAEHQAACRRHLHLQAGRA